jgi:hypothetical protein
MATAASLKGKRKLAAAPGEEARASDTEPSRNAFHISGH